METPTLDRPIPKSIPKSLASWPLSAPESYVLLHGSRAKSIEAFKKGLLELVARDVLTVEAPERRGLFRFFTRRTSFLLRGPKMPWVHSAASPLRSIWEIYSRTSISVSPGDPRGVRIRDLRRSARGLRRGRARIASSTARPGPPARTTHPGHDGGIYSPTRVK